MECTFTLKYQLPSDKEGSSKEFNPSIEFGVETMLWVSSSARARRIKKSDVSTGIGF